MIHTKTIAGDWVKAAELVNGTKAKLTSGVEIVPSKFNEGKFDNVTKIKFADNPTVIKNARINRATLDGLIDAFGPDDANWIDKPLTVQTEKAVVAGKRVTVMYLIPEGFEMKEDGEGYVKIVNKVQAKGYEGELHGCEVVNVDDIPF